MVTPESQPQRLRVAHLNPNAPTTFHLRPDEGVREALAAELGLDALTRLDFRGTLRAHGTDSWLLTATLAGAEMRLLTQFSTGTLVDVAWDSNPKTDDFYSWDGENERASVGIGLVQTT